MLDTFDRSKAAQRRPRGGPAAEGALLRRGPDPRLPPRHLGHGDESVALAAPPRHRHPGRRERARGQCRGRGGLLPGGRDPGRPRRRRHPGQQPTCTCTRRWPAGPGWSLSAPAVGTHLTRAGRSRAGAARPGESGPGERGRDPVQADLRRRRTSRAACPGCASASATGCGCGRSTWPATASNWRTPGDRAGHARRSRMPRGRRRRSRTCGSSRSVAPVIVVRDKRALTGRGIVGGPARDPDVQHRPESGRRGRGPDGVDRHIAPAGRARRDGRAARDVRRRRRPAGADRRRCGSSSASAMPGTFHLEDVPRDRHRRRGAAGSARERRPDRPIALPARSVRAGGGVPRPAGHVRHPSLGAARARAPRNRSLRARARRAAAAGHGDDRRVRWPGRLAAGEAVPAGPGRRRRHRRQWDPARSRAHRRRCPRARPTSCR